MKKLLTSAAVCGLVFAAAPAHADLDLEIGGYFKGYTFYTDQDDYSSTDPTDSTTEESRDFDIIRNTEIHFGAETTLDNGLTVGFHTEAETDATGGEDSFSVDESYAYFSGGWGRVNFGSEDGAAYLLQVAAPSADSNLDGIRQYVNPVNYAATVGAVGGAGTTLTTLDVNTGDGLDYDQDVSGKDDKITYLSPIMNGFQLGATYTPEFGEENDEDPLNQDDQVDDLGEVYDLAVRYEGMFNNVGVILGAGYTHAELEKSTAAGAFAGGELSDDRTAWNVGADLDIGPFGVGVAYMEDDYGEVVSAVAGGNPTDTIDEEETIVVGVDYTTGPFKLGASYMDVENTSNIVGFDATDGIDSQRYTAGVVYTYGPGMTFRGSISHVEHEDVAIDGDATSGTDVEATSVLLGTQINF
jgi:predicted porin